VKKRKVNAEKINLLDLIPVQNLKSKKNEDGLCILLKPKFSHPLLIKYLLPRLKSPHFKVKLDEIGSFIWSLCNGKNTVKDIGLQLKEEFGERVEPLYERLGLFFQNLEKNRFITFKNL
jgi:hypothetical protein